MRFVALILCIGALVGLGWYNVNLFSSTIPQSAIWPDPKTATVANLAQKANENDEVSQNLTAVGVQTLTRPLFSQSRRPFQKKKAARVQVIKRKPTPVAPDPPAPERPVLLLLGVSSSPKGRRALIQFETQDEQWVSRGEQISQWTVSDISNDQITLSAQNITEEFKLFEDIEAGSARLTNANGPVSK